MVSPIGALMSKCIPHRVFSLPDMELRLAVDSPGLVINRGEGARAATKQQSALDFSRCGLEDWVRNLKRLLVVVPSPSSVSSMLFVTLLNTWLHLAFPFLPQVLDAHVWSHFPLGCLSQDSILH